MRNESFRSSACWSHIWRLVASELDRISHGARSAPLTSTLKLMPLALTFMSGLLLGEGVAERVRGIDAEHLQLLGKERQLFEGERESAVVGVAFDVDVELRGEEIALDHVAFQLGHVDAVGGKAAQCLV